MLVWDAQDRLSAGNPAYQKYAFFIGYRRQTYFYEAAMMLRKMGIAVMECWDNRTNLSLGITNRFKAGCVFNKCVGGCNDGIGYSLTSFRAFYIIRECSLASLLDKLS